MMTEKYLSPDNDHLHVEQPQVTITTVTDGDHFFSFHAPK